MSNMFSEKNSLVKSLPGCPSFTNRDGMMGIKGKEVGRKEEGREREKKFE